MRLVAVVLGFFAVVAAGAGQNSESRTAADAMLEEVYNRESTQAYCLRNVDSVYWTTVMTSWGTVEVPVDCRVWMEWYETQPR